ncbi:Retrotransposon protein, Ty3-gypsy subclass [Gossypium australe]|uniref:Retrotransposon protein, Ty3-gypsy subclass n=1 Tax=Gossypium australe TaxID=47621 RepID=A0A5B6VNB5_9ROSI|nr:Retrotransposon protein, Ty3-gypsy subclass [Gossypium australe]
MALYEALYGCKCRTPLFWIELSEKRFMGKSESNSRQSKSNFRSTEIIGNKVFLKVSPWKKILRFSRKDKLSPCFI